MKKFVMVLIVVIAIAAVAYAVVGRGPQSEIALGKPIPGSVGPMTVAQALKHAEEHPKMQMEVVLEGVMQEKCPMSGCWFYLSDDTGRIRVDTQYAGFDVLDVKTGSKAVVYGKIVRPTDGEPEISALGARF